MGMTARIVCALVLVGIVGGGLWYWQWHRDEPRRECLHALERLENALKSQDATALLDVVALPEAFKSRTPAENREFVTKALHDEISPEGIAELKKRATFGPLEQLFPAEAQSWATQAGVRPEDCVAFKSESNRQRIEVVLVRPSKSLPSYRILRCDNVNQLAGH